MIALLSSVFLTVVTLLIPNGSPYSRLFRPSFLLALFSVLGLSVTAGYFGFAALSPSVTILYALGVLAFCLGDFVVSALLHRGIPVKPRFADINEIVRWPLTPYIYLVATGIGTLLLGYLYLERSAMFNMFELGTALRYAGSVELPTYGAFHFLLFAQAVSSVLVLSNRAALRWIGYGCFLVLIFGSFVSVSRTTLFFNIAALTFLLYVRTSRISIIIIPGVILVGLTFYYAVFANKDNVGQTSFFYYYVGYAVYAFNNFVIPLHNWDYGINSLGSIGSLLAGGIKPEDLSLEGTEYNVYTFIGSPYRDLGTVGVILFPLAFGAIWSLVWNKSGKRPIYTLMYSWMIFPCVIPFFDWKFNLTSYIYLIPVYLILVKTHFEVREGGGDRLVRGALDAAPAVAAIGMRVSDGPPVRHAVVDRG